jgi:hypothetical protein
MEVIFLSVIPAKAGIQKPEKGIDIVENITCYFNESFTKGE